MCMKQINPHEVEEGHVEEINTKDDLIVLAKAGYSIAGGANPIVWLVVTAIVIVIFAVVPITLVALAFGAGHFSNWFLSDNPKRKR